MKKNLLIIQHVYPLGQNTGDKIRTMNMIKSLNNIGFNVYFIAFFTRGLRRIFKEKVSCHAASRKVFYIYSLPNRLYLNKLAAWLRSLAVWMVCRYYKIDVIQAELTHSVSSTKLVPEIPLVTDFHADFVPELEMRSFSNYNINCAKQDNMYALKRSVRTITVSQNLHRNLSVYCDSNAVNYVLPCNFDAQPFRELPSDIRQRMRRKYMLEDRIVLCYSGGLHVWQCIEETITIILQLYRKNSRYFFCLYTCDDTTEVEYKLRSMKGNYMIKKLSRSEVPAYLSLIDAGFVLRKDSPVNTNASPTKSAEYFAAGAMVIASRYAGDVPDMIRDAGQGIILPCLSLTDKDIDQLDKAVTTYCRDYDFNSKIVKDYVFQNRIWTYNEEKLRSLYQDIGLLPV